MRCAHQTLGCTPIHGMLPIRRRLVSSRSPMQSSTSAIAGQPDVRAGEHGLARYAAVIDPNRTDERTVVRPLRATCALAGVIAVVLLVPATALATPTNTTPPSVRANPQMGQPVTCQPGVWTTESGGQVTDTDFTWYLDNTSNPIFESGSGFNNTYVPSVGELGHTLICEETVLDTGDDSIATAYSVASAAVLPVPSITITQYSPEVSGNVGENLAGVQVAVSLHRPTDLGPTTDQVASASTTTSADGSWTATLSPSVTGPADAFGAAGGQLTTQYSPPIGMPSAPVPAILTYADSGVFGPDGQMFQGDRSMISADGTTITSQSVAEPDCPSLSFIIDGHTEPTAAAGPG